jgi:hypothetical protein
MAEIADLSVTDANNTARFPEGQSVPTLNNGARALEGLLARANKDRSGYTVTTGSGTAYAILTNGTYPAHAAGMWFMVRAHVANSGAATLTVNALAAKPLRRQGGDALVAGDIALNQTIVPIYNSAGDYYECLGVGESTAITGWGAPTGTATRTTFATGSVTLPQLAERVKALIDDLTTKGVIGA